MAGSFNKATIMGNVGKDPDVRHTQGGSMIVNFSIATSETWRDKGSGDKKERTQWHNIVVFNEHIGKVIEQYVKKGSKVLIEGQIETREWEKDGVKRYSTEIVLRPFSGTLVLLGDGGGSGGNRPPPNEDDRGASASKAAASSSSSRTLAEVIDDDIPF